MDGLPPIMSYAHAVLCARDLDEASVAFAALCVEDLAAARALAQLLNRAVPQGAALWAACIAHAEEHPTTKPWRWARNDPADTASAVDVFLRGRGNAH